MLPSGFASSDPRVLGRLAEAIEGLAEIDAQELPLVSTRAFGSLVLERDDLRSKSEELLGRASQVLIAGSVSPADINYQMVVLARGNIIFNREVGSASREEKAQLYKEALARYQQASELLPDDPRPLLYQGLCRERLTDIAETSTERMQQFALGEEVLRRALTLNSSSEDYNSSLPYRALASLYAHMNDFCSVLDSLKKAQQADPSSPESPRLEEEIRGVEQYLSSH